MTPLEIIGIIVAVEGLFKALDYFIGKITANHDKNKKIEDNSESLSDYIEKSEKKFQEVDTKIENAHKYSVEALKDLEKTLTSTLNKHREEYLSEIKNVHESLDNVQGSITEMKAVYQQTVAIVDLKISSLEKATNKHNSIIERTYILEKDSALHEESIKNLEKRLENM